RWEQSQRPLLALSAVRCGANNSVAIGAKGTCRGRRERVDPAKMTHMYGPAVRCKKISPSWGMCGLASMYRPRRPALLKKIVRWRLAQTSRVRCSNPRGHTMSEFTFLFRGSDPRAQSPEEMQKSMQKWLAWFKELGEKGHIKYPGHPLERAG